MIIPCPRPPQRYPRPSITGPPITSAARRRRARGSDAGGSESRSKMSLILFGRAASDSCVPRGPPLGLAPRSKQAGFRSIQIFFFSARNDALENRFVRQRCSEHVKLRLTTWSGPILSTNPYSRSYLNFPSYLGIGWKWR